MTPDMMPCGRRCPHGGVCALDNGHDGDHEAWVVTGTGLQLACSFTDAEAVSNEAGDELWMRNNPGLEFVVQVQQALELQMREREFESWHVEWQCPRCGSLWQVPAEQSFTCPACGFEQTR